MKGMSKRKDNELKEQLRSYEEVCGNMRGLERVMRLLYMCDNFRKGRVESLDIYYEAELAIMGQNPDLWISNIKAQISSFIEEIEFEVNKIDD